MKKFLFYLKFKPILYAIAVLCLAVTIYNQYLNHRLKFVNTDPWIVSDVVSGDRLIVERNGEKLEVQLCGISASSDESKKYLLALLNKGDGSVILDRVRKQEGTTIAEVFMQITEQQEIHLNTEMLMGDQAKLADYKACPNAEYFEMTAEIEK